LRRGDECVGCVRVHAPGLACCALAAGFLAVPHGCLPSGAAVWGRVVRIQARGPREFGRPSGVPLAAMRMLTLCLPTRRCNRDWLRRWSAAFSYLASARSNTYQPHIWLCSSPLARPDRRAVLMLVQLLRI